MCQVKQKYKYWLQIYLCVAVHEKLRFEWQICLHTHISVRGWYCCNIINTKIPQIWGENIGRAHGAGHHMHICCFISYVRAHMSVSLTSQGVKWCTPVGGLQRSLLSSGKARTQNEEGGWNEHQRGLALPPDIVFPSFSHHTERERTMRRTDSQNAQWEQHSQLFQHTEEREKSKRRGEARRGRTAVKDLDARGDKVPHHQGLCSLPLLQYLSSKLDAKHVSTRPELEAAFGSLLSLWTFLFLLNVASYVSHPSRTGR